MQRILKSLYQMRFPITCVEIEFQEFTVEIKQEFSYAAKKVRFSYSSGQTWGWSDLDGSKWEILDAKDM